MRSASCESITLFILQIEAKRMHNKVESANCYYTFVQLLDKLEKCTDYVLHEWSITTNSNAN